MATPFKSVFRVLLTGALFALLAFTVQSPATAAAPVDTDPCRVTFLQRFDVIPLQENWRRADAQQVVLWSAFGSETVELKKPDGEWEPVADVGFLVAQHTHDSIYSLRLVNADGWAFIASATFDVEEHPHFMRFDASPSTVATGGAVEVSWSAAHADFVLFHEYDPNDPNDGPLHPAPDQYDEFPHHPLEGTLTVRPTETTVYEVLAIDAETGEFSGQGRVVNVIP